MSLSGEPLTANEVLPDMPNRSFFVGTILFLGSVHAQTNTFEVASLKRNNSPTASMKVPIPSGGRFTATNVSVKTLISMAWKTRGTEILGAPAWTAADKYDVDARAASPDITREQYLSMLQSLLSDRFKLRLHQETRELPVYTLNPFKSGLRLKTADEHSCAPSSTASPQSDTVACGTWFTGPVSLDGRGMSTAQIAAALAVVLGRPVTDRTFANGRFDLHLEFNPDGVNLGNGASDTPADSSRPSIFTALQEQAGLKLESHKEPAEIVVIDSIERAAEGN
jgi:uncharacterized protein (TIGR03435 family)